MASRQWRRPSWLAVALTIVGVALFARLGFWQYARMQEKRATLDTAATVLAERKALPLARTAYDPERAHAFDWVEGTGAFADRDPILLDDQIRNGRVGVRVYRVFYMEKEDRSMAGTILIDLGWLPLPADRKMPQPQFPVSNRIDVRGLLSAPPSSGIPLGAGIEHSGHAWVATRIDIDAIAPKVLVWTPNFTPALAPRVLRLDPALPMGFERDLDVLPSAMSPERHLGYAVQWWALALASIIIFVVLHWRKAEK